MKKLLAGLLLSLLAVPGWSQTYYNIYGPVTGVQYNAGSSPFNTAATAAQIANPFGCTGSQALTGTGGCSSTGGTVTNVSVASVPSWETSSVATSTTTPAITIGLATGLTANQMLATPNGSTGTVGLRTLVGADIPAINLAANSNGGVTGILPGANGGTGNGFFAVSGPATSLKTFTFPNASATVLTTNAAVTVAQGGTGLATLTVHGVLLGEGTSNIGNVAAMAADTLLQGQGATSDPAAVSVVNCGSANQALSYSTSTHTFGCQSITTGVSIANPSATIGLTAVNGVASTVMASDSAPALSQAIAPTWSATHIFHGTASTGTATTGVSPGVSGSNAETVFNNSGGAANSKLWDFLVTGTDLQGRVINDAFISASLWLDVTRSATTVSSIVLGNTTDKPPITLNGAVTIPVPTSGFALTVSSAANSRPATFVGSSTSGQSFGPVISSGTTSADDAFFITNQSGSTGFFRIFGDGGVIVGPPTGGNKGAGTINSAGTIYTNNVGLRMASISATCTSGGCSVHTSTTANGVNTVITRASVGSYSISFSPTFTTLGGCSAVTLDTPVAPIGNTPFITLTAISNSGVSIGTSQNGTLTDMGWAVVCNGT